MIENAYNYHTHTVRCGHATGEDREYVEEAIRGGIKKMGFSDHISLRYPDGYEAGYRVPTDRAKEYAESVRALQKEYAGKIEIFLGFETEYYVDQFEKMLAFSKELGVDYWILGQHFVGGDRDNVYSGWEGDDENRLAQYAAQVCAAMETGKFSYVQGAASCNFLLADEINRTTPRTQSALLECMQEQQATVDGVTYRLDDPFFVIATQNPIESQGTFPLPEAQNDRFLMKLSLGYPSHENEKKILGGYLIENPLDTLVPVCTKADVLEACDLVKYITVSENIKEYIIKIAEATRDSERLRLGISTRAALSLMRASQAYAAVMHRDFVIPDDVKKMAIPVLSHRILVRSQNNIRITDNNEYLIAYLMDTVKVPIE